MNDLYVWIVGGAVLGAFGRWLLVAEWTWAALTTSTAYAIAALLVGVIANAFVPALSQAPPPVNGAATGASGFLLPRLLELFNALRLKGRVPGTDIVVETDGADVKPAPPKQDFYASRRERGRSS